MSAAMQEFAHHALAMQNSRPVQNSDGSWTPGSQQGSAPQFMQPKRQYTPVDPSSFFHADTQSNRSSFIPNGNPIGLGSRSI